MKTHFTPLKWGKMAFALSLLLIAESVFTYSGGPPAGHTNAPGESNCTACHNNGSAITTGSIWNSITLTRTGSGGLSGTIPNASNAMNLSVTSSANSTFGFMLGVLPSSATSSSASVGSLTAGSSATQTTTSSSPNRIYLEHTSSGNYFASGTASWNFNWITPTSFTGGATFYVAVNVADGDASSAGDDIYVKTFSANVLPVKWLDFTVDGSDHGVQLIWSTATEINNEKFVVERSEDGNEFRSIGEVKGKGNATGNSYYVYTDTELPSQKVFYRLRQVDHDGVQEYSRVLSFDPQKDDRPEVLVNKEENLLLIKNKPEGFSGLELYALNGDRMQSVGANSGNTYSVNGIPSGIYLLKINDASGKSWVQKVMLR